MSKRLSLSLSGVGSSSQIGSPKPSIFGSLLANKNNSNLKSTNTNSPSSSRHSSSPKKLFNLDSNDEIDLVRHTPNDYEFTKSSSQSTSSQLKKKSGNNIDASGSNGASSTKITGNNNNKIPKYSSTQGSEVSHTQNSSRSSSPTKSQSVLMSTPPSSPIKMRKLESSSSESFDEFDDTAPAKILESSDSDDDFDTPVPKSKPIKPNKSIDPSKKAADSPKPSPSAVSTRTSSKSDVPEKSKETVSKKSTSSAENKSPPPKMSANKAHGAVANTPSSPKVSIKKPDMSASPEAKAVPPRPKISLQKNKASITSSQAKPAPKVQERAESATNAEDETVFVSKVSPMSEASTSSSEEFTGDVSSSNMRGTEEGPSEAIPTSQRAEVRLKTDDAQAIDSKTQEANKPRNDVTPKATSSLVGWRLLAVSFDSEPEVEVAPKQTEKSKLTAVPKEIKSDDDFEQPIRPVITRPSLSLSLKSRGSGESSQSTDKQSQAENRQISLKAVEPKVVNKSIDAKKTENMKPKAIPIKDALIKPKPKPVVETPKPNRGTREIPLNINSDSSFEVESPIKTKAQQEEYQSYLDEAIPSAQSRNKPVFSLADLSRARSERIKRKSGSQSQDSGVSSSHENQKEIAPTQVKGPTIRSKTREFAVSTEEEREKFIQWSLEELKSALAKANKSSAEDNFTEDQVKDWSKAKITAWKLRHTSPNTYYYRFTDLDVPHYTGKFTVHEHTQWMKRYIEFKLNDWPIGNYWGAFSKAIPHRVGYQCASHFRNLVKLGIIVDNTVKVPKLDNDDDNHIDDAPVKSHNVLLPENELSLLDSWKNEDIKEIERRINQWICDYHNLDLSSHNEKNSPEVSPSNPKKRKAEEELNNDNTNLSPGSTPSENGNKKRKIVTSPVGNSLTLERFGIAVTKKSPSTSNKNKLLRPTDRPKISRAVSSKSRAPVALPSGFKQRNLSHYFPGVASVDNSLKYLMESGKIPYDKIHLPKAPMSLSWARTITPYVGDGDLYNLNITGYNYASSTLPKIDWDEVESAGPFFALLLDPPLRPTLSDEKQYGNGYVTIEDVQTWIKVSNRLIPKGFLFVWIEKEFVSDIIRLAKKWKFLYVENLMWMKKYVNNKMMEERFEYINKSKLTLLLFRKGHGDMELRHQRNPDVVEYPSLDIKDDVEGMRSEKPMDYVYNMIETLLPEANFNPSTGKGRMLEVWASRNAKRKGWTHIFVEPSSPSDLRESMDSLNNSMQVIDDEAESDDEVVLDDALNESELFGEEKSSEDLLDSDDDSEVDFEALLDHETKPATTESNDNAESKSVNNDAETSDAKVEIVINVENNESVMDDDESGSSLNDEELEHFWNAITE